MARQSAGILLFRRRAGGVEVLLVHPGGPFWSRKDEGAWSLPKGEFAEPEDALAAARREFQEETGSALRGADGDFVSLGAVRQAGGKLVHAWAIEGDFDPATLASNTFLMEWPRGSGAQREFPEADRAEWFDLAAARRKLLNGQRPFIDALEERLGRAARPPHATS